MVYFNHLGMHKDLSKVFEMENSGGDFMGGALRLWSISVGIADVMLLCGIFAEMPGCVPSLMLLKPKSSVIFSNRNIFARIPNGGKGGGGAFQHLNSCFIFNLTEKGVLMNKIYGNELNRSFVLLVKRTQVSTKVGDPTDYAKIVQSSQRIFPGLTGWESWVRYLTDTWTSLHFEIAYIRTHGRLHQKYVFCHTWRAEVKICVDIVLYAERYNGV